ncbi:MAG: hypothetical protein PUD39_08330 [Bacteroidales bacterium]|nr:hypothetical protein [Bacteroidales bacterium]
MDLNLDILFPPSADVSSLVVACKSQDYSASAIARAVEDCDAHVVNLNVLSRPGRCGELQVSLRIDRRNPSRAVRSLQRYGYEVVEVDSPDGFDADAEQARSRANELLRYLEM